MIGGIEYALGAMACFGIADAIYKRAAAAGTPPRHLLMAQSWVFMPSVALYGLLTGTLGLAAGAWWGSLAGLFMWLGFYNFAHSLQSGALSVNAPIFRLSFIMTAILAILVLGEPLSPLKTAGIVCAVIAVWLLSGARPAGGSPGESPGGSPGGRASRSSLLRVLIAMLAVGLGNLIYKYGLRDGATPASLVVAQAAVVVSLSTGLVLRRDGDLRASAATWRHAPLAGVVLALAFILMVEGLARGEASKIVPIAQMGLAVSACLGIIFLGESLSVRKGLGLAAALSALACFANG